MVEALFRPRWAGGWTITRVAYALAGLLTVLPRFSAVEDAYASSDMVFSRGPFFLADHVVLSPASVYALLSISCLSLLVVARGGAFFRPALLIFLVTDWLVLSAEALNIKAYDRLQTQVGLVLLLSPAGEAGLMTALRSPVARWYLLAVYSALYGSTGWMKLLNEPAWWEGKVLAQHLVHPWFGSVPLGVWVSDKVWLTVPFSWMTVIAEASFPFLIQFRRTNPWILLVLAGMHLGIFVLMSVGPFSFVAVAAYPALLHPEVAQALWERLRAWGATHLPPRVFGDTRPV
jgi:hypothetical protein